MFVHDHFFVHVTNSRYHLPVLSWHMQNFALTISVQLYSGNTDYKYYYFSETLPDHGCPCGHLWFKAVTITGATPAKSHPAGLGSIQFRNWNCSSIPIPIPELELELKLVELKMELELKPLELELELKTGIEFLATATTALTS